ncbi:MAG: hypothetical protein Kow0042_24940 [Calditrichia bacterium]
MLFNWIKQLSAMYSPLRPPGALPEKEFEDRCIRCRKCQHVCPFDSIKITNGAWGLKMGTPVIYPRQIPCYLCMKCPPVCPSGALNPDVTMERVRMGVAKIDESTCLPYQGILCRACYERCPIYREAIVLEDQLYPKVIDNKCTGCGICENVCPTDPQSVVVMSYHFTD